MRKVLLLLVSIISFVSNAQNIYKFEKKGRITENGVVLSPSKVRDVLANNQAALQVYNNGRSKKTFGNVLLTTGLVLLPSYFVYYNQNSGIIDTATYSNYRSNITYKEVSTVPFYLAGAMIIVAIPIKIGFSSKIRKAVDMMNEDVQKPKTTFIESADFISNANGFGISLSF